MLVETDYQNYIDIMENKPRITERNRGKNNGVEMINKMETKLLGHIIGRNNFIGNILGGKILDKN